MTGIIELGALIVSSLATTTLAANALYLGTLALAYGGLVYGTSLLQGLFVEKPSVPKPEDGSYNLKQNVPSLAYVLGRVKKGGDYAFLEEINGIAFHIIVMAAHQIQGYVQHYLHDEKATVDGAGRVTSPAHFVFNGVDHYVVINTRLGLNAETAYPDIVGNFPTIWSNDHRGDGLATIRMSCATAGSENYLTIYPNQMPVPSSVIDGALLYDPRVGDVLYRHNLALMRLWHLTNPVGGKLGLTDMYLPDWAHAADVCDQIVINRSGGSENRYHGGLWFRAETDPVQVGRTMDQAAELVVFERPDGLIGVHAGEYTAPDIRLVREDVISFQLDGNTRDSSTVLAVRGRYTDPGNDYNSADAAIYGNPYVGEDTERTKTLDNTAVQSHNHVQRLQKITYIRANAPKISVLAHYEAAKQVPYRRFVRVHIPPKMNEVIVEITATPKLSLRNMTIEFSGIIVPDDLYDFDGSTEEGEPGANVEPLPRGGVPLPQNFNVTIQNETLTGGQKAAYALATWDLVSNALIYELEWESVSGSEPARSTNSKSGEVQVRSNYLSDGVQYRFRLRAWSNGANSDWTAYEIRTATADPTPPATVIGASATGGSGQVSFSWTAPNSPNYAGVRLYLNTTNTFVGASLVATEYGPPNIADGRVVTGVTAGTKYGFIVSINASGTAAAPVATGAITVT
ncbi:hypothetical protein EM858_04315 [Agrobacterium sp. CNPSo 2736]|uniref:hypothetical protein n=1 Tax=Agrobacterium sp. CNPSo 2736 TaxID=2499627 RepID=UPI000FDB88C4|nr:hypothetical protein [Agrobacterium sp. CNPSo 2736]RVT80226.1 hypothetical protein EM858_04315 [Agrobacterium sp. CNPSo 2736]